MAKSQNEIEAERRRGIKQGLPNGVIFTDDSTNTTPGEPLTIPSLDDKDGLRKLATQALVEIISTADKTPALVGAIRELLDRIDGKPQQNIKQDVDIAATITRIECVIIDPMVIEGKP